MSGTALKGAFGDCALSPVHGPTKSAHMTVPRPDRFVQFPTELLDALLRARLNGAQWRVLLWVVRNTHGWNRSVTSFTWYQVAKAIALDRATAYRAGQALLRAGLLVVHQEQLGLQEDPKNWGKEVLSPEPVDTRQLWMPGMDVVRAQRKPLSGSNAAAARRQRFRCEGTTVFRRARDSSKDNIKTYQNRQRHSMRSPGWRPGDKPTASAAPPVPGKYDGLSQN